MTWRAIPLNLGDNIALPGNVVLGSDGNMWTVAWWDAGSFTYVGVVIRTTSAGVVTTWATVGWSPTQSTPSDIAAVGSPLWWTDNQGYLNVITTGGSNSVINGAFNNWDAIHFDGTYVWVAIQSGYLLKYDSSGTLLATYATGLVWSYPHTFVDDGTNLWLCDSGACKVHKIPKASPTTATSWALGGSTYRTGGLTFDGTYLWATVSDNTVQRFTPAAPGTITTYTISSGYTFGGIFYDGANIQVAGGNIGAGDLITFPPSSPPSYTVTPAPSDPANPSIFPYFAGNFGMDGSGYLWALAYGYGSGFYNFTYLLTNSPGPSSGYVILPH